MLLPDEVPDDAEPWENRPDAVVDQPCVGCGGTDMPLHVDYRCPNCHELDDEVDALGPEWFVNDGAIELIHEDIVPWLIRRWGLDGAAMIANQVLAEIEVRQRGDSP